MADFVEIIKRASLDAMENSDPSCIMFGKVVSEIPLKIQVNVKLILEQEQLVLTRNVTEHTIKVTPNGWGTGSGGDPSHSHGVNGSELTIHNELKLGEEVILIRQSGGQEYIVLDRVG